MGMNGSMRQRSTGSWELRVFTGTDPATGRRCYRSKTVRGNRAEAERELATMVDIAGRGPTVGARSTVGELLEPWYAVPLPGGRRPRSAKPVRYSTANSSHTSARSWSGI